MSKKYEREQSQLEHLEKEIKRYKEENRSLLKKLKVLNKGYYKYLYSETEAEEKEALANVKAIAVKICWNCNVGNYKEIIVINRRWRQCDNCGKRGKVSII
jgi:predicted nuclease with TOPRIM domain